MDLPLIFPFILIVQVITKAIAVRLQTGGVLLLVNVLQFWGGTYGPFTKHGLQIPDRCLPLLLLLQLLPLQFQLFQIRLVLLDLGNDVGVVVQLQFLVDGLN